MKKNIFIISIYIFVFLFSGRSFGQTDTLPNKKNDTFEVYENKYLKEKGSLQYELISAQNDANEQRIYKNVILSCLGFVFLLSLLVIYIFLSKSKQINELIKVQNREIKLRETQVKQLSLVLNNIDSAVLITFPTGKIRWLNRAFEKFYGYTLETLQENNKDNFINDLLNEQEKTYINKCINEKTNFSYIVESGEKDFKLQRNFLVVNDDKNELSGIAVTENRIF
jgi:PAS domain S-box-containing protein